MFNFKVDRATEIELGDPQYLEGKKASFASAFPTTIHIMLNRQTVSWFARFKFLVPWCFEPLAFAAHLCGKCSIVQVQEHTVAINSR